MVKLTEEQKAELEALEAMPDDQIDYSDIPETTEAEWSKAKRGMFYQPDWQNITLRLDQNVIDWVRGTCREPRESPQGHQSGPDGPHAAGEVPGAEDA